MYTLHWVSHKAHIIFLDLDTSDIIKSWFREPSNFRHHPFASYLTKILRDVYKYLIVMCFQLHGCKNAEVRRIRYICSTWWYSMVEFSIGNIYCHLNCSVMWGRKNHIQGQTKHQNSICLHLY